MMQIRKTSKALDALEVHKKALEVLGMEERQRRNRLLRQLGSAI